MGYPFLVCFLYCLPPTTLSVVKAAQGAFMEPRIETEISGYYLADEIQELTGA